MIKTEISGKRKIPPPIKLSKIEAIPNSLRQVTTGIAWAVMQTRRKSQLVQKSMFRIMDRSLGGQGDRLETLQSMRALEALITISNSIISQLNSMSSGLISPSTVSQVASIGQVVDTVNRTGNQAIALSGNNVILSRPNLTPPPLQLQRYFAQGGSTEVNAPSYFTVPVA